MVDVDPFPIGGERARTRLWVTASAVEKLGRYLAREQPRGAFLKRLDRYSANGFGLYEGEGRPVRHEGDGVYRIAEGLFRLLGFYTSESKAEFVVIDAIVKRGPIS